MASTQIPNCSIVIISSFAFHFLIEVFLVTKADIAYLKLVALPQSFLILQLLVVDIDIMGHCQQQELSGNHKNLQGFHPAEVSKFVTKVIDELEQLTLV